MTPADTRFLVDTMCGGLTSYLRMCGYDAAYALDREVEADDDVAALAREENRVLLTRDVDLAARVDGALLLTARDVGEQLAELAGAGVALEPGPPVRCGRCNGELVRVSGDATTPEYAPDPAVEAVWRCVDCGQHFWRGSHWDDVRERLANL